MPTTESHEDALNSRLDILEKKVNLLADHLNISFSTQSAPSTPSNPHSFSPKPLLPGPTNQIKSTFKAGQILGYAGIACLFLAIVLLIRLSVESGWLNPERQLVLATTFGAILILIPFVLPFKFKDYMSQLPALGIVVFHLTIYGGVFYQRIIGADTAILLVSGVGILSLALLEKFEYDGYILISIIGTYLGALFLKSGFPNHIAFFSFLVLWNIIYCSYSILSRERNIILITAYLSIGIVSLRVLEMPAVEVEYIRVAFAQFIQFLIFLGAVTIFSTYLKRPLKNAEAWSFFPLILFFYGLEFHLISKINPHYATALSLIVAAGIFLSYKFARKNTHQSLESADVTYTAVAAILSHGIYLVELNDQLKILTPFILLGLAFAVGMKILSQPRFRGGLIVLGLVCSYSFALLMQGSDISGINAGSYLPLNKTFLIITGTLYGIVILFLANSLSKKLAPKESRGLTLQSAALLFAHSQILLALYRMKLVYLNDSLIAPLWIAYAFAVLFAAYRFKDRVLAQSSFPVIALGLIRFLLVDFSRLNSGSRIIALLVMGALIFAGGYLYKKTVEV